MNETKVATSPGRKYAKKQKAREKVCKKSSEEMG